MKDLLELCLTVEPGLAQYRERAEMLTPFAVEIRYPGDFFMPEDAEARQAMKTAVDIKDFLNAKPSVLFADAD